jgi:DNA-binding beta-propeller fold protein YncE
MLRRVLVVLAGVVALVGLGAGSASASNVHVFSGSFGGAGSTPADPYPLSGPSGVAVDEATHHVYVVDAGNFRVEEFDSAGVFVSMFGKDVDRTKVEAAASEEEENVCTLASGEVCQAGVQGVGGSGQFSEPAFVAVDNSGGPSEGDVYVGDRGTNTVYTFTAGGGFVSENSGLASGLGAFGSLAGIAVDTSGDLWVYDLGATMFEFEQGGGFLQEWHEAETGAEPEGIAVDSKQDLYAVSGSENVRKYASSGEALLGEVTESRGYGGVGVTGLAVDPVGNDLYVDQGDAINSIASSCVPSGSPAICAVNETFGSEQLSGVAALAADGGSGTVYAADAATGVVDSYGAAIDAVTGAASAVTATSAVLGGTVNPEGSLVKSCEFEYETGSSGGLSAPCEGTVGSGTAPVAVHADLTGLRGGSVYRFRLLAGNAKGSVSAEEEELSTLPVPVIEGVAATGVTATSADLNAQVNPEALAVESCVFEYGTEVGVYSKRVECTPAAALIGSGTTPVAVSAHIEGLEASRYTYHWRVVARDVNGTSVSGDQTFVDDTSGGGLPDGREYEMVTPPQKDGALLQGGFLLLDPDVAEDGARVIASSLQCFAEAASCTAARQVQGEPFEFTRTSAGWVTTALAPAATQFAANSTSYLIHADTGMALFGISTAPAGEDDLYARQPDGSFVDVGPTTPPADGALGAGPFSSSAATADFSHVVYQLQDGIRWPFDAGSNGASLYEYVGDGNAQPVLVGVSGGPGSTDLISTCGTELGSGGGVDLDRLSADGGTVFFTAQACASGSGANAGVPVPADALYARIEGSRTVLVSGRSPAGCTGVCLSSPPAGAEFAGASADGSKVFFTDTQQLTDDASEDSTHSDSASDGGCQNATGANGCNLYEYDFANPAGENLLAVSAGDTSGGGPRVQGVIATSSDGSHVYFVAKGVLSGVANGEGQLARDGAENLYVFERDARYPEGHVAFIAALSGENLCQQGSDSAQWCSPPVANVTPDGRFLVFTSRALLTRDDTSTTGVAQVFRYDADQTEQEVDEGTPALVRISIGQDGYNDNGNAGVGNANIAHPQFQFDDPGRTDTTMSNDGSFVFFQSPVGLTPQALNDVPDSGGGSLAQNVYEWHEGQVYLISDGRDTSETAIRAGVRPELTSSVELVGSDATGANVFFTTTDQLVPQDTDTGLDYYDARICTASEPCVSVPPSALPCVGEACRGVPGGAPSLLAPASASFAGLGNLAPPAPVAVKPKPLTRAQKLANALKACHVKKNKHKRAVCEATARKRYGPVHKAKKAKHASRKAGR